MSDEPKCPKCQSAMREIYSGLLKCQNCNYQTPREKTPPVHNVVDHHGWPKNANNR